MIDSSKIEQELLGLVGYEQPLDPNFFVLDPTNLQSDSGLFVTRNPYVNFQALLNTQDYENIDEIGFNTVLRRITQSSISAVANAVFTNKNTPSFIDRQTLYKYPQNKVNVESLPQGFICHKLTVTKKDSKTSFEISRVLLDFQGTGDITLYLFSTASINPIKSKLIAITSDHQEVSLNWKLDNLDGDIGGEFYIGYFDDGTLTTKPYKRDYERSNIESEITHIAHEKRVIKDHLTPTLWDLYKFDSISEATGLNFDITVYNDYTNLIIQNKSLFANAINLECAIQFLNVYRSSLRSNKDQRLVNKMLIDLAVTIEGQRGVGVVTITGLRPSLSGQINLIQQSIKELMKGYFMDRLKTVIIC